jgi:tRNA dimethylallyltransferase
MAGSDMAGEATNVRVVAVFGPTASGKTALAEALADATGGGLVSCDAMQAYRGLPILTNQPQTPTALVGIWPPDREGSVAEYQALAHAEIDDLVAGGRLAIVVGGTGLYLRAALAELVLPPAPGPGVREHFERLYDTLGATRAHALLADVDPRSGAAVHPNDRRRVVRALELAEAGTSLQPDEDRLWSASTRHPTLVVGLDPPRELLAGRIAARTAEMLCRGAREEALRALEGPISTQARQIIGLREFEQGLTDEDAAASICARTRAYARRQRVWMRRIPGLERCPPEAGPEAAAAGVAARL